MIRDERGSTLLLVLFMIVIFTMLGMAVLAASLGGAQRSEVRENDVQSLHLAEKALNEAVAYLAAEFDKENVSFTPEEIRRIITDFTDKMDPKIDSKKGLAIKSDLNTNGRKTESHASITGYSNLAAVGNLKAAYQIKIEAQATVNGVTRKLSQMVTLDTYPDFLKYAAGSEGNVMLNGAPDIRGELYTGGKLKLKHDAEYQFISTKKQDLITSYPRISSTSGVVGKAIVQGVQGNEQVFYCSASSCDSQTDMGYTKVDQSESTNANNFKNLLGINKSQVAIKEQDKFVPININESFIDKVTEAIAGNDGKRSELSRIYKNGEGSGMTDLISYLKTNYSSILSEDFSTKLELINGPQLINDEDPIDKQAYRNAMQKHNSDFKKIDHSILYEGDLNVDGDYLEQIIFTPGAKTFRDIYPPTAGFTKSNWLIIHGDLNIINSNTDPLKPIQISGNILVTGEIYIKGNVEMDATIMSLEPQATITGGGTSSGRQSTTTIIDATIRGYTREFKKRQLLLISKGEILINRVDAFARTTDYDASDNATKAVNEAKVLQAYFYTDQSATLYGVGSTFWIRGGFFAKKDLTINAALGQTDKYSGYIDSNDRYNRSLPRLVIEYNPSIFDDQNVGLPRVNSVNITVEKKKLE